MQVLRIFDVRPLQIHGRLYSRANIAAACFSKSLFTPKDQMRKWIRVWPQNVPAEELFGAPVGGPQSSKK